MGSSPRRNLSLPISTDGFPPRGGLDILSLPISTSPRAGQPDLKGWVPGEEEDESVESSIVPSLHLLQGAVSQIQFCFENIARDCTKRRSLQKDHNLISYDIKVWLCYKKFVW